MEFKQCIFRTYDGEPDAELGGIAVYKFGNLIGVICMCCGGWRSAKRVQILAEFPGWVNIGDVIVAVNEMAEEWIEDDE
jgi:hypothetical protein